MKNPFIELLEDFRRAAEAEGVRTFGLMGYRLGTEKPGFATDPSSNSVCPVCAPVGPSRTAALFHVFAFPKGKNFLTFQRLAERAGNCLPAAIKDELRRRAHPQPIPGTSGIEWWLTFLWSQSPGISPSIGETADGNVIVIGLGAFFRESADAIGRCRLHVEEAAAPPPIEDGPVEPDGFRWKSKVYHGLARKPFRALQVLWACDGRAALPDDLAEPVYGDREPLLPDNALAGLRRELNRFFRGHTLPWHAEQNNAYLAILDGPPKPAGRRKPPAKLPQGNRRRGR